MAKGGLSTDFCLLLLVHVVIECPLVVHVLYRGAPVYIKVAMQHGGHF